MSDDELVLITRASVFKHEGAGRFYVVGPPDGRPGNIWAAASNPNRATRFPRKVAEKLLARGRWANLDPRIEEVPDASA